MDAYERIQSISPRARQYNRPLKLDTPAGEDVLLPLRAVGHSRIGRDYGFTVDMVSASRQIELRQLIAQPVTLWIRQNDKSYQPHHGYVHTVRRLGADGGLVHAQLEFASWLHFLRFRKDARIWQDRTVPEILTDVFNAHPQARGQFRFNLYGELSNPLPRRSFCMQYEDDWNFVHRLMESEGLWCYFEQAQDGQSHTLVITDYNYFCDQLKPGQIDFSRTATGAEFDGFSQWSGTRTLQSMRYTGVTGNYKAPASSYIRSRKAESDQCDLHEQTEVYEYTGKYTWQDDKRGDHLVALRMEEMQSRAKRFHGAGSIRRMDAGRYFELRHHPDHEHDTQEEREFLAIEVQWFIASNLQAGNTRPFPGSLEAEVENVRAGYLGDPPVSNKPGSPATNAGDGFFLTLVEAQRMSVPYRSPFEHRKPQMRMQTATVTGPEGEEVYTDESNRIKGRFEWDRLNKGNQNSSCWLRVAMSDTGGGYGGVHVPRVGEEVLVDWIDGDCDRPIVTGRVYNGLKTPRWHSNGILSGYRSKEYGGSGYNQMVLDDATGQCRMQLYSSSANSQLHLGYLIAQNGNTRGTYLGMGFDLKSDGYGAVRAGWGLYMSTHTKGAANQQLDVSEAQTQLSGAQHLLNELSQTSEAHQAESLQDGAAALKAFTDATLSSAQGASASGGNTAGGGTGSTNAFSEPVMLMASPAGIGLSTQQSTHITADRQLNLISGESMQIATGKSLVASICQKLSLFVRNAGMKLFAGQGKIEIQAQNDAIELIAKKVLSLISTTDWINLTAKQGIRLRAGTSELVISLDGIKGFTPGDNVMHAADHQTVGPQSVPATFPGLPDHFCERCFLMAAHSGSAIAPQ